MGTCCLILKACEAATEPLLSSLRHTARKAYKVAPKRKRQTPAAHADAVLKNLAEDGGQRINLTVLVYRPAIANVAASVASMLHLAARPMELNLQARPNFQHITP